MMLKAHFKCGRDAGELAVVVFPEHYSLGDCLQHFQPWLKFQYTIFLKYFYFSNLTIFKFSSVLNSNTMYYFPTYIEINTVTIKDICVLGFLGIIFLSPALFTTAGS